MIKNAKICNSAGPGEVSELPVLGFAVIDKHRIDPPVYTKKTIAVNPLHFKSIPKGMA